MISLEEAAKAVDRRKGAICAADIGGVVYSEGMFRRLLVGTDINLTELLAVMELTARAHLHALEVNPAARLELVLGSAWVDGLLTGILFVQMGEQEARR